MHFSKVEKHVDGAVGHAAGNFQKARADLTKCHEHEDDVSSVDFEQEYFEMKMGIDDYPPTFVQNLDKKRILVNENVGPARQVSEDQFIYHVLAKLPKSEDEKTLNGC